MAEALAYDYKNPHIYRGIRLALIKDNAESKGLLVLNDTYNNCRDRAVVSCLSCGVVYETTYDSIVKGKGCAVCVKKKAGVNRRLSYDYVLQILRMSHMKMLRHYIFNGSSRVDAECMHCGHVFSAFVNNIKKGSRCPACSSGVSERKARIVIEHIFGALFPPSRPSFLLGMHYDGYNEDLRIAFEYDGPQHYRPISRFEGVLSNATFQAQSERDINKDLLSSASGVTLMRINGSTCHRSDAAFIKSVVDSVRQSIDVYIPESVYQIDLSIAYENHESVLKYNRIIQLCDKFECFVISKRWSGTNKKMVVMNKYWSVFSQRPDRITDQWMCKISNTVL